MAGMNVQVLSRVTTETGSWCRVQQAGTSGSVPCRALEISNPEPPRVVLAQPVPPPAAASHKPVAKKGSPALREAKPAHGPSPKAQPAEDLFAAPTPAELRKILPQLGNARITLPTGELNTSILQEYKFSTSDDLSLLLWVRPTGQSLGPASHEITQALAREPAKIQSEFLPDGRRLKFGKSDSGVVAMATSPRGEYEWTIVYATADALDDIAAQVLDAARRIDRLLFQQ